jgi:hypothetical protein
MIIGHQVGTVVEVEPLHGRRKRLSQNLSCPVLDWRGRRQTDPYIHRLYILFRIAEIDSDTYWIDSASGIGDFVDEVTFTREVERANRRFVHGWSLGLHRQEFLLEPGLNVWV